MGYTTRFTGELKFVHELSIPQLRKLESMFDQDCRDHPEWSGAIGLYHIDLELNEDYTGIRWNGTEKTYAMDQLVNVVIREMRKDFPEFGVTGQLAAQGEDVEDRWVLVIEGDGFAHKHKVAIVGQRVTCPHCEGKFIVESPEGKETKP